MSSLYGKYKVERTDGKPLKRPVFVISPETDRAAQMALIAYTAATTDLELRADLMQWIDQLTKENNNAN